MSGLNYLPPRTTLAQIAWLTSNNSLAVRDVIVTRVLRLEDPEWTQWATTRGLLATLCNTTSECLSARANETRDDGSSAPLRLNTGYDDGRRRRDYYSAASCALVAQRFAVDFAAFGYDPLQCL